MPYYRIFVWTQTRRQPFSAIRWIETDNINLVQGMMEKKAHEHYKSNFIDCEVQMLAKTSQAIQKWLEKNGGKVISIGKR